MDICTCTYRTPINVKLVVSNIVDATKKKTNWQLHREPKSEINALGNHN